MAAALGYNECVTYSFIDKAAAALFGGLFLVLSDTLARTALAPRQLPVGVVTALLGVPLFLLLLNRARVRQ